MLAFTRYGLVIFEQVTAPGDTVIDRYLEPNPPALPDGFDGSGALYFDLSTTSTHVGAIEICLGMSQPFIEDSDGVRLLQFVGDSWVDVTTSVQSDQGRVCGVTTSLSTFAVARQIDDTEPERIGIHSADRQRCNSIPGETSKGVQASRVFDAGVPDTAAA